MNKKNVALENKVLVFRAGSQLYGTDTPTSDLDKVGVFLPPVEHVIGLRGFENVDLSKQDKGDDGRNTKDAVDFVLHEFTKFVQLAMDNNPNILELLFADEKNILYKDEIGQLILDNAHIFPHKRLYFRFKGYAQSQKHKMRVRTKHWHELQEGIEELKKLEEEGRKQDTMSEALGDLSYNFMEEKGFIEIADMKLQYGETVKSGRQKLEGRYDKFSNRSELISDHGFDTKFGSHLIRLLTEGIELLKTGRLQFPIKEAELVKDIKNGRYSVQDVLDLASYYEGEAADAFENTDLPEEARFDEINDFVQDVLGNYICTNFKQTKEIYFE